jgi:hypothetical protein
VSMPKIHDHNQQNPGCSSDGVASKSEYVIGTAICEFPESMRALIVGKMQAKQDMIPAECIV